MNKIKQFNELRMVLESSFSGLPHSHTTLIKSLLNLADPTSGIVKDISYHDLAKLLEVEPAPGRKDSGIPTKQTIRNYIKTIERDCGTYFKVISEGQKLQFFFPEIPKVFKKLFCDGEINIHRNNPYSIEYSREIDVSEEEVNRELDTEVNPFQNSVKNINILNITKQNKLTPAADKNYSPKPISPTFCPSPKTIATALQDGFTKVEDREEIKKFISYNLDKQTLFDDYNEVFLLWLRREKEYSAKQQRIEKHKLNGDSHVKRSSSKSNSYESIMQQALIDNANAVAPSGFITLSDFIEGELDASTYRLALDSNDCNLRTALYK